MKKTEFVEAVAEKTGMTKKDVDAVTKAGSEVITETLAKKEDITFLGFGTFSVAERAAREGRNPSTGEKIQIKAAVVPKFKAGKALKDAVAK